MARNKRPGYSLSKYSPLAAKARPDWWEIKRCKEQDGVSLKQQWQEYKAYYGSIAYSYDHFVDLYWKEIGIFERPARFRWRQLQKMQQRWQDEQVELAERDRAIASFYGVGG